MKLTTNPWKQPDKHRRDSDGKDYYKKFRLLKGKDKERQK